MSRFVNRGFSLIELSIVLIISCIILAAGLNFLRAREYQSRNEVTLKQIYLISQAAMDYINANNDTLQINYLNNGMKPWILPLSYLNEYIISDTGSGEKESYTDGYGNHFAVLLHIVNGHVYGLLVNKGDQEKIPSDILSVLKNSAGSQVGGFDPLSGTLSGTGNGWSFPVKDWQVAGIDFSQSPFVVLIRSDISGKAEEAVSSFNLAITESSKMLNSQVRNGAEIEWQPTFSDDKLVISFQKNNNIDYIELDISPAGETRITEKVYGNSFLVKPVSEWINKGKEIQLSFKPHNKFSGQTEKAFNLSVKVEKINTVQYFKKLFSRIDFQYQTVVRSGKSQPPDKCYNQRDFVTTRITEATLLRVNDSDSSGNLLQPLQFKLTYAPSSSSMTGKENTLFLFQVMSTSDTYRSDPDSLTGYVDISDGGCGPDTSGGSSKLRIYIKDYFDNKFKEVGETGSVNWHISLPEKGKISW